MTQLWCRNVPIKENNKRNHEFRLHDQLGVYFYEDVYFGHFISLFFSFQKPARGQKMEQEDIKNPYIFWITLKSR